MPKTISGTYTSGISLSNGDNPVFVTGTIAAYNDWGIYGQGGGSYTWTIDNAGSIITSGEFRGDGFLLGYAAPVVSADVTNESNGVISGGAVAVSINGTGSVTNLTGGTISSVQDGISTGVNINGGLGTISNSGLIKGYTYGVFETVGGTAINNVGGTIEATDGTGIRLGSGTITNAGMIGGTDGRAAIQFYDQTLSNRLILEPGAEFTDDVFGGDGTMELAAGSGTIGSLGNNLLNFSALTFDPGARWKVSWYDLEPQNYPNALAGTNITGFASSDTIDLIGVRADSAIYYTTGNRLVLTNAGTAVTTLSMIGAFKSADFSVSNTPVNYEDAFGGQTFLTTDAPCYCSGTLILTPSGEIPVEQLAIGDLVVTRSGEAKPIRWIGRRSYDGRFIKGNRDILPIRIAAGALADGLPKRDLDVSPGHAMLIDGVLVPAERLVNGINIRQLESVDSIEYIHLELAAHDIIIAEGALAETYVDCDNRGKFLNVDEFDRLYPNDDSPKWAYCAPWTDHGDELARVRRILGERLDVLGYTTSLDPELGLLVDGCETLPDIVRGDTYLFRLTKPATDVRIISRSSVPADITESTDPRRLGVNLSCLILRGAQATLMVEHNDPSLIDGFHHAEATHRWTDGNARIPLAFLACFTQNLTIEVRILGRGLRYRVPPEQSLPVGGELGVGALATQMAG